MLVRITKGEPTAEELAALTAALVGALARRPPPRRVRPAPDGARYAGWQRLERLPRHAVPGSWRRGH
ncbi:acyl-CoA carboxylase epsilon subunit [Streptomyces sp. NPDC059008]|uniref:acyl-CoA carboxylase epsilon subunit n=1 Tax=Streptomyces sp. NPDC059008 TaxID=3346693 RepID=UPI003676E942